MEQKPIEFKYSPRSWGSLLHTTDKKRAVLIIHRQGGKTTACLHHLVLYGALTKPNSNYAYVAPFYKQAKGVAWDNLKRICLPLKNLAKFNEQELTVRFPNGSKISLYGADNPDSLRGLTLHGIILDEYSQHPANIWTEILEPTLATTNGYAFWIGTPKGKNLFYELYQIALKHPEEYLVVFRTIEDTINEETGKTVEALKNALAGSLRSVEQGLKTEDEHRQEYFCSFDASVKGAYYALQIEKARTENRIKPVPVDDSLLTYTVWDLGVSDAMSVGFFQKEGNQIRMVDYYENTGYGLPHYIQTLRDKGYTYGSHFAPHDISQRELSTGRTRLDAARELGITFQVVPSVPLQDGIDTARRVFSRVLFDAERCSELIDKLSRYHKKYDDKKGIFLDRPEHDDTSHAADMFRYMSLVENNFSSSDLLEQHFEMYSYNYS